MSRDFAERSSGVEAALAADHFDLVISDLKMPGQNGAEIFRFIRENYPPLAGRFLLMSGNLADAEKYADELKTVTVLPKPFTVTHLRRVVNELLQKATASFPRKYRMPPPCFPGFPYGANSQNSG